MREIKTVSLIGLGAMGAVFTPGLCRVLGSGFRVIAGGERKQRLEKGVTINGEYCTFPVVDPDEPVEPADLVIVAVKDQALPEALEQIRGHVGPDTILMPVLNGLDCARQAGEVYGMEKVLYASMWVSSTMENGVATYDPKGFIRFGEAKNDPPSPRVLAVADLLQKAGIHHEIMPDMIHCIWFKFMGNVSENLPCALLGVPYGAYHNNGPLDPVRRALMQEVAAVAKAAAGVELTEEHMAFRDKVTARLSSQSRPSTLQDLDRGRRTEIEMFAGTMLRLGEQHGVPTPLSFVMYHGIKTVEAKQRNEF